MEEGRTSRGRVEHMGDEMGMEEKKKGERLLYKGRYTKGVRRTYKNAEGLVLLQLHVNLSADQSTNLRGLTKLYLCSRICNPFE